MTRWYKLLLPVLLLVGINRADAQRTCGSADYLQQQITADPGRAQRLQQIEQFTSQYIANNAPSTRTVVTIPVVVHVVYNTAAQNISDAMVQAQIDRLNQDYRKLNADAANTPSLFASSVADCQVNFCLAQRDPNGAATNGIRHVSTTKTSFTTNDAVKYTSQGGDNAWPSSSYLNLWTCNLGQSLLGYAQFPGGAAATDGVVILYSSLPGGSAAPYNLGRTATHEVGHWLNLYHIWGDDGTGCNGSDNCADTPNQGGENYGCPAYPHPSCSNTSDMFMNYMDYTDDACMYMFTNGQASRMAALFAAGGSRASILNSLGCQPPSSAGCGTPVSLSSSGITSSSATLSWAAVSGATSYNLQYQVSGSGSWTTVSTASASYSLTNLAASTTYNFQVQAVCTSTGAYSAPASFTTQSGTVTCVVPGSLSSSNVTTSTATVSWGAVSGAASYNLQYQAAGSASWTTVNTVSASANLTGLSSATTYNYQVQTVCSATSSSAYSAASSFITASPSTGCSNTYESNNSQTAAAAINTGATYNSLITPSGDVDWYRFSNTAATPKIKVTLTNLPGDYDIRLYRGSTYVAISQNGGTTSETIKYNTTTVSSSYYVQVYGYNGANSASQCYALSVLLSANNFKDAGDLDVVAEHVSAGDIDVYPNPTTGKIAIDYLSDGNQDVQLYVIDMMGRSVMLQSEHVFDGPNTLFMDMNQLSNGMYMVMVKGANGENSKRVMLQR